MPSGSGIHGGPPTASRTRPMPIRTPPTDWRWFITASSRTFVSSRASSRPPACEFQTETDTEVVAQLVTAEMRKGRRRSSGGHHPAAPSRRLRARIPVRRRGRSVDRRPPRGSARHRLRGRRDVSGLGRPGARAVHGRHHVSGGWRLGHSDPAGREYPTIGGRSVERARARRSSPAPSSPTKATTATSWRRRSTSSRRWWAALSPIT